MKKILLGLLALSATVMATESTGVTGDAGNNQIDITTKAFIVDSGLIITETENGSVAIKSVELDHGTILKSNSAASFISRDIYIRKNGENKAFPEGSILEISLKSPHNNLTLNGAASTLTSDKTNIIPHILTAKVDSTTATTAGTDDNELSLTGTKNEHTNQFSTVEGKAAIKVTLKSDIATSVISDTNRSLEEGAYSNTSTLSVKFSKIPQVGGVGASGDKTPLPTPSKR